MGKFFLGVWEDSHKDITTSLFSFRFERLELQWKTKEENMKQDHEMKKLHHK
jgi:hypothetical protein